MSGRAIESAKKNDEAEAAAVYRAEAAVREALVGNADLAKRQAQEVLALSTGRDVEALSSVALGMAGDGAQATRMADDFESRFPRQGPLQVPASTQARD